MVTRIKKNAPALKHGSYSATALLPGEDPAALKKLHDALIAEFSPVGALEEDIVASIARLVWRKRHLATFRVVGLKRDEKMMGCTIDPDMDWTRLDPDKAKKDLEALFPPPNVWRSWNSEEEKMTMYRKAREAQKEYEALIKEDSKPSEQRLFMKGEIATIEQFMDVLAVEERLDTMIDRCLKRLLFLRGLKSLAPAKSSSQPPAPKRLRNP